MEKKKPELPNQLCGAEGLETRPPWQSGAMLRAFHPCSRAPGFAGDGAPLPLDTSKNRLICRRLGGHGGGEPDGVQKHSEARGEIDASRGGKTSK